MIMVVIFATIAIFALLNAVQKQFPLAGMDVAVGAKKYVWPPEVWRRGEQTLGLNKPFYLAYLTWLGGEDSGQRGWRGDGNPGQAENKRRPEPGPTSRRQFASMPGVPNPDGADPTKKLPCNRGVLRWDSGGLVVIGPWAGRNGRDRQPGHEHDHLDDDRDGHLADDCSPHRHDFGQFANTPRLTTPSPPSASLAYPCRSSGLAC